MSEQMKTTDDAAGGTHASVPGPRPYWNPYLAGLLLGLTLLATFVVAGEGLGASAFPKRILALAGQQWAPEWTATNPSLSGYVADGANPLRNWLVVEVIGVQHRLLEGITSGYGFSGIVAALFGGLHPLGTIPASYLFGSLLVGADKMQRAMQVPSSLVNVLLGLIVLFVVGSQYYARKRAARRAATTVTNVEVEVDEEAAAA